MLTRRGGNGEPFAITRFRRTRDVSPDGTIWWASPPKDL